MMLRPPPGLALRLMPSVIVLALFQFPCRADWEVLLDHIEAQQRQEAEQFIRELRAHRAEIRKFNADMGEARRRFWETYPDDPGHD